MTRWLTLIALALSASASLAACSRPTPLEVHSVRHSGYSAPPASPALSGAPGAREAAAAAPHAESQAEMRADRAARPGLGTQWGETRDSRVSNAPFERSDPERPFALASLHYNDREGIQALLAARSYPSYSASAAELGATGLSVRLLDEWGNPLQSYGSGAHSYVVGEQGQRYVIQVRNRTNQRFEVVATVDGLDVIDGAPGSFEKRGYLMRPDSTLEIEGFRRSTEQVAAFRFGGVADSYAARKGDARNVGVIGVAFFQELGAPTPYDHEELLRRDSADPFPGRFAQPPH